MPLLMKQRNGYPWVTADREEILAQLRGLLSLSPHLGGSPLYNGRLLSRVIGAKRRHFYLVTRAFLKPGGTVWLI